MAENKKDQEKKAAPAPDAENVEKATSKPEEVKAEATEGPIDAKAVDEPVVEKAVVDEKLAKEVEKKDFDNKKSATVKRDKRDQSAENNLEAWVPKTEMGKQVKLGQITDINEILDSGKVILEAEITDTLLPNMDIELMAIGQSKGKFGGGQRRVFRQTQKKTKEGNKPKFSAYAICGNYDGYIGHGYGKSKETVPAREKSFRQCKLNIMKVRRACGSWECNCGTPHTIPYKVTGKCGSVEVTLMPAPKGTGLCVEGEIAKILKLAGIKDCWSKTKGKTKTKINHVKACLEALRQLTTTKIKPQDIKSLGIVEGKAKVKVEN